MQRMQPRPQPVDLSQVPLVDNHCHGLYHEQGPFDVVAWRRMFTESSDESMRGEHVATTLFYRRLIREMAAFFRCAPEEEAVLAARAAWALDDLIGTLLRAANVDTLLVDQGYPPRDQLRPDAEVAALASCRAAPMLRVELLMQRLIVEHATLEDVIGALRATLADLRAQGYVALKSIVAYRSGLEIQTWPAADVAAVFAQARQTAEREGSVRLGLAHKPLLDGLLHVVFAEAARQEMPIQFHVGYGDTDADLLRANPLLLRAVLEERAYRGMPVVLLHECYPYTREGAYLAAVYEHAYLDLSYGIPFLGRGEMLAFTRAALGVAPHSKLMYSSDAVGVPEQHWMSARMGRAILGQALGELVASRELDATQAEAAGAGVLSDNARRLYRL
jgi:hypothetical protein